MAQPQLESTAYKLLEALPEGLTGEILDGQIHAQSRSSTLHGFAGAILGSELIGPFQRGKGGSWWLVDHP